ncbi:signal transduction histidine kinase [Vibrio xiamenensis]|uniref:histidine kinase n=1 Tax=Vibrio xiamenensis TaxID=861298 RepID=A0A1G8DYZ6_9VIBR|nr:ATP-binding protein [Vibrio xiamenensis]SDH62986.1 signal transduction histidine kinase [Vibrio xiamenensis]
MNRTQQFEESIHNPYFSVIGRRIIFIMIVLSSVVTLATTVLQLYWDYDKEFNAVSQRHAEIKDVHADTLAASLWAFDLTLLQERLEGLVNLPGIDYIKVTSGRYEFSAGKKVTNNPIVSNYALVYHDPQPNLFETIGTIEVESDAQQIYHYLMKQFFVTLAMNALKTIIVCYFILLVFHHSVNRRVFAIAQYLRKYNPRHPAKTLKLSHTRWIMNEEDELDWLADESNKITDNVSTLYRSIKFEQERLSDFTHVSSDWLWETDANGQLTYSSEAMLRALRLEFTDHCSLHDIELLKQCQSLLTLLDKQHSFNKCEECIIVQGEPNYFIFQAIARYEKDIFLGFRGTAINITDLKMAQLEVESWNIKLEQIVAKRTQDLEQSMQRLQQTQEQLVESEKLAALGGLVAGVAHEVNTPLGIAVTATSVIQESAKTLQKAFTEQTLTSTQFSELMTRLTQSGEMLEHNLNRAAKLVRDFKQTAVDQVSESRSEFRVKQVLDALIASLHPETRKVPVTPNLVGDETVTMNSLPGVLTQILSNLVMNSVNHAFTHQQQPQIDVEFEQQDEWIILQYRDNGDGIEKALHSRIFEPFYTTKRGKGGSGLGLNLVFNLVKQKLKGELEFDSEPGKGVHFTIKLPKVLPQEIQSPQAQKRSADAE